MMHPHKKGSTPDPCSPLPLTDVESPSPTSSPVQDTSTHVYINVLGSDATWSGASSLSPFPPHVSAAQAGSLLEYSAPRPLRAIDPTITFISPYMHDLRSYCSVFRGHDRVYYEETGVSTRPIHPEQQQTGMPSECRALYTTRLAPSYWPCLCDALDPTEYTIHQQIVRRPDDASSDTNPVMLLSVVYHFVNSFSSALPLDTNLAATSSLADHASPALGSFFCDFSLLDAGIGSGSSTDGSSPASSGEDSDSFFSDPLVDEGYASVPPSPLSCLGPVNTFWDSQNTAVNLSVPSIAIDGNCMNLHSPYFPGYSGFGL